MSEDEGQRIEPENWSEFSGDMHKLLDECIAHMKDANIKPWKKKPNTLRKDMELSDIEKGQTASHVFNRITEEIMPYATGNTHPRFWGWVHGTGVPVAVGAEMVAAAINCNCGGRDHIGAEVERAVIEWLVKLCNLQGCLPMQKETDYAFGVLTSGTSIATVLAMSCARRYVFGTDVLKNGITSLPKCRVYAVACAHSCFTRALETLGHGNDALMRIPAVDGQMSLSALQSAVTKDRDAGVVPMAIVATAGSVNLGEYDDFVAISDYCRKEQIWLHVDAAFGFWIQLATEDRFKNLANGIGNACSIALDFHKWMGIPYDCGAFLCYSEEIHRTTFSNRPAYLQSPVVTGAAAGDQEPPVGLAGGDLWMCDYTLELSRGFKALKVWTALQAVGTNTFSEVITDNCEQVEYMANLVDRSPLLQLARPVISNICCFRQVDDDDEISMKRFTPSIITSMLQLSGDAVFSTTMIDGHECLRAAIVNQRTTRNDT